MSTALTRIEGEGQGALARFQPENLAQAMEVAKMLATSGLLPDNLKGKPADILATLIAGAELGLTMMASFRAIYLVKGKVGFSADFIVAKAIDHPDCEEFRLIEEQSNDKQATYRAKRRGQEATELTYTLAQAARAGLTRNPTWTQHPEAMLRARCASAIAKIVFPDTMFGIYSRDEAEEIEGRAVPERELNPPPPPAPPQPPSAKAPVSAMEAKPELAPALGVAAVTKRLMAAGKGKAKDKPAPMRVVDVQPGETEEDAIQKTQRSVPTLRFGELKGKPIPELSAGQLADCLEKAREHLATDNGGRWTPALRAQIAALEHELDSRQLELEPPLA